MKPKAKRRDDGGTLLVALFTCCAIGIVLVSALSLASSRHKLTVRSTAWNAALAISEAGIEEAFAHWHCDSNNPTANGWGMTNIGGEIVYSKKRYFEDGSYFLVTTYNATTNNPIIYSAGFVPSPLERNKYISRLVKVMTTNPPSMFTGVSANGLIDLRGNVLVDGYDSSLGPYNGVSNRNAFGKVATNAKSNPAVEVNTTKVYGQVLTGPGGTITVGSGSVGGIDWNASHSGIEPGWTNNNMNVAFPSNAPPSGGPFLPVVATSVGGSNIFYLGNVTNYVPSFSISNSKEPLIVTGHAVLWVGGDLTISGNAFVYIAPGASLQLYVGGSANFGGGGVINATGRPVNFSYLGLSSNTSVSYSGTSDFIGTITATQAAFSQTGTAHLFGAVICNSYLSTGTGQFHYDSSLGGGTGLVALGWTEL